MERFALRIMTVWGLRTMPQNIQRGQASRFLLGLSFILFRETLSHLEDYPKERIPAQDFIDLVKAQGGVCFAAHPFRNNNRGLEENLALVHGLDGVEVLNGSTSFAACMKAAAYARQYGYFTLGSSDCHVPEKVGVCATYFPNEVRTMDEFLTEFKKGQMKPAYYVQGGYRVLEVQNNDKKSKIV